MRRWRKRGAGKIALADKLARRRGAFGAPLGVLRCSLDERENGSRLRRAGGVGAVDVTVHCRKHAVDDHDNS